MSWINFEHDGRSYRLAVERTASGVWIGWPGRGKFFQPERKKTARGETAIDELRAPMTGRVVKVKAAVGERLAAHQTVVVLEAMKMEYQMHAPFDAVITGIFCKEGDLVDLGALLARLEPAKAAENGA